MPETKPDLYALPPDAIREPPTHLGQAFLKIGPGLILAGSVVGTGELIATTHAGAQAGFALLWFVIFSCFIKVFVQIELGRYAISSGETTMTGICRAPGGRLLTWWWLIMLMATLTQVGAMVGGTGQAFHMAMPGFSPWVAYRVAAVSPMAGDYIKANLEFPWTTLVAVVTSTMLAIGSYGVVEKLSTVLVVMFTVMTVGCVVMLPSAGHPVGWEQLSSGLTFQLPAQAVMTAFALLGLTGVGANELVAYPYWCIEKGYARSVGPNDTSPDWLRRAKGWLRVMQLDAWTCLVIYTTATLAFFLLVAAVLHETTQGKGLPNSVDGMMEVLSQMYAPVMGQQAAVWFIIMGAFAVLYSTLVSASAGNARMLTDMLRVNRVISIPDHGRRMVWIRSLSFVFPIVGLVLFTIIGDAPLMVLIGGVFQSVTLPLIAVVAVYLRYRHTDRRITPGVIWDLFLWLSMIALTVAAGWGLFQNVKKLF